MNNIPEYLSTAYNDYKTAAEKLRDFRTEVDNVLEMDEELTREKTRARNMLDNATLKYHIETPENTRPFVTETDEDLVTIYKDQQFTILDETLAVRAIIQYCDQYKLQTNVDLIASLLKVLVGSVRDRIEADPTKFGLVEISQGGEEHWYSPAFEIKNVTKVRVSQKV